MNNIEIAAVLRKLAAVLDPTGQSVVMSQSTPLTDFNMFTNSGAPRSEPLKPWMPGHPEYTPDKAWQIMLRRYARDAGLADSNTYVKEKHARGECGAPAYPDEKQSWEP